MSRVAAAAFAAVALLGGCSPESRIVVDGWVLPTPYPLPAGARALALNVDPYPTTLQMPLDARWACPQALIGVSVEYVPGGQPDLQVNGGVGPVWPWGVSARLVNGRAEIVGPDGRILARDGDEVAFGGGLGADDRERICLAEYLPKRA